MAAMAAFTFSSCEDVPEPYTQPTKPDAPTTAEAKGTGTAADPFNIAGIIKYIEDGGSADQEVYTKGVRWYQLRQAALMPVLVV